MSRNIRQVQGVLLLSELHRQSLGTKTLQHCLALTDEACLPVRLEYLKWNPVGTLYKRHGFRTIGESDIPVYGTGCATSCPCFSDTKRLIMFVLKTAR